MATEYTYDTYLSIEAAWLPHQAQTSDGLIACNKRGTKVCENTSVPKHSCCVKIHSFRCGCKPEKNSVSELCQHMFLDVCKILELLAD